MTFQALADGPGRSQTGTSAEGQNAKFNYIRESAREGNERNMFETMLAAQGVSPEESEPYRKALDSCVPAMSRRSPGSSSPVMCLLTYNDRMSDFWSYCQMLWIKY